MKRDQAVKLISSRAKQTQKPYVMHQSRNGQWLVCHARYWFENRDRLRNAHVIYPNGDGHVLQPQNGEPL